MKRKLIRFKTYCIVIAIFSFYPSIIFAQSPWTVIVSDFQNSGQVVAVVVLEGTEVTTGYLGAFVGDECRGVVEGTEFPPTGKFVFSLLVYSNASSGEELSFRYYDDVADRIYPVTETKIFVSDMLAYATDPDVFHAVPNAAPVADCPDKTSLAPAPGPITFNLCDIFTDPDGDPLTYDPVVSAGATFTWNSGCELEFMAAAEGTSTLTLTASDGVEQAECNYSFTVDAVNGPPVVAAPLGTIRLDEGFGTFQVDLDTIFSDPDGDVLNYSAGAGDASIVTVSVAGSLLTILEGVPGNTRVTVGASDSEFSIDDVSEIVIVATGPPLPWEVTATDYQYSGQIDAVVQVNGAEVTSGVLGAFVGEECRGIAEGTYFPPSGRTIFSLISYSNMSSGEYLTFRYYDPMSEQLQRIEEVVPFEADMKMGGATDPVVLHLFSDNHLPAVDNPISDQDVDEHFGSLTFDLAPVFSDPDGDVLSYSVSVSDATVVGTAISGTTLTITEAGTGPVTIVVTASDGTFSIDDRFILNIAGLNDPPVVAQPLEDQSLQEGFKAKKINISGTFTDPEGDALSFSASSSDAAVVTAAIVGADLVITEAGTGAAVVTVCVSDGEFETCDELAVSVADVNFSPDADCTYFSDTLFLEGAGGITLPGICDAFSDSDGDVLTYSVRSDDEGVVTGSVDGCDVVLTGAGTGTATVTVCATDGVFEVCCAFDVTVAEENVMELFLEDRELADGDSISHCSDVASFILIVFSDIPWTIASTGDWFTVEKTNALNAAISFTENTTGAPRSGSIVVRDTQEHVVDLVVYQSATCFPAGVAADVAQGYRVYPNPVQDLVTIVLPGQGLTVGEAVMRLYASDGRLLRYVKADAAAPGGTMTFDMRPYRPGIYTLVIEEAGKQRVRIPLVK